MTNHTDEQIISATAEHPLNGGWLAAKDLRAGDRLLLTNGKYVVVEFVQHELLENTVSVYNFEVVDNHNYYVAESVYASADGFLLVHNTCGTANISGTHHITNKEATKIAKQLNYKSTNFTSKNGAKVFTNGKNYISADVTSHNGGYWKMANSISDLNSKTARIGTFNKWLTIRIGD